jgi:hypothetical protein
MPLEVIGAGFGRTGTMSMKIALEALGYKPCHHMKEVLPSPEQIAYFDQLSRGERPGWEKVFDGFSAAVDWPAVSYYEELIEAYPDAKVVLTARDAEAWHKSVLETIYLTSSRMPTWLHRLRPSLKVWVEMVNRQIWDGTFSGNILNKQAAIEVYESHVARVKSIVPAERLLVHSPKDGWEPLCAFLDKPVPSSPYPHANESAEMKRVIRIMDAIRYIPHFVGMGLAFSLGYWLA